MSRTESDWVIPLKHLNDANGRPVAVNFTLVEQTTPADRDQLRKLAKGKKRILEIGTFTGSSTLALLEGMAKSGKLVTLDNFKGNEEFKRPGDNNHQQLTEVLPHWIIWGIIQQRLSDQEGRYQIVYANSKDVVSWFPDDWADLIFIDGAHDYKNVKRDIREWLPKIRSGGVLAGHDYEKQLIEVPSSHLRKVRQHDTYNGCHPGVALAARESFSDINFAEDEDSTVWWVKV